MNTGKNVSFRAALLYLLIGFAWIFLSDRLLTALAIRNGFSIETLTTIQNTKGILFVVVCAVILFLVIRRSTKKLERSQLEYRNLFRHNPAPMFIYHPVTGNLLAMNEACCAQYGYTHKEMKSLRITDIRISQFNESDHEIDAGYTTGLKDVGLYRHCKKNGTTMWIHKYARRIEFGNDNAWLILAFDVSEQIVAEERLLQQNTRLAELAWFESHKLRAPVARLLGLLNVINMHDPQHPQNETILQHIRETGLELDQLVHLLSTKTVVNDDKSARVA
jgi:PAS domain S-box-containing protein